MSTALPAGSMPRLTARSEKFTPPMTLPNGAPMMTPTARSTTFPFIANSLNSDASPMAFPCLYLSVQSYSNYRYRPTVAVVGGMTDPLIIETEMHEFPDGG